MTFYLLGILAYFVVMHGCVHDFNEYRNFTWDDWVGSIALAPFWPLLVVIAAVAIVLDFNDYRKGWK